MKASLHGTLDTVRPLLRELVDRLNERFDYASVLAVEDIDRGYRYARSGIDLRNESRGCGYVVRVYDKTGCGEYSFNELSADKIPAIVERVASALTAIDAALPDAVETLGDALPADAPATLLKATEYAVDPVELGDAAIVDKLRAVREKGLAIDERIVDVAAMVTYRRYRKIFISKNRDLDQTVQWINAVVAMVAARGQEIKQYYQTYSALGGAELLDKIENDIDKVAAVTLELLEAEEIVPGEYECICDPATTGMIVHEAFGHGVEMDMFVKDRALAAKCVGEYVASPLVTMHDGSAVEETATAFFDDEGTLTGDTVIIDRGILKGGMCDALSAGRLGVAPTGNGRREDYTRKAYTRMTNTYFEGGDCTPEEMIGSVKYGFLLENPNSGMEDPKNWGIQCMVNIAREIKDGKLTGRIFSPIVLTGYVPDLLKSVTMMSGKVELSGSGFCGKGYKEWVKVSDGGPYMKARIRLG